MRLSLLAKYSLVILSLIVSVVCTLAGALSLQFRASVHALNQTSSEAMATHLLERVRQRGAIMARFLAEDLIIPVHERDLEKIQLLLNTVRRQQDVIYIYVYDVAGHILHDGSRDNRRAGTVLTDRVSQKAVAAKQLLIQATPTILDIAMPMQHAHAPLGGLRIGLSLEPLHRDTARMATQLDVLGWQGWKKYLVITIIITVVLLMLGIGLAVSVARRLLQPIRKLADYTLRIGRGEYDTELTIERSDEIGELANAFEDMRENLQRTTISKKYVDDIISHMTDALVVAAPDRTIKMVNDATCRLLGYKVKELVGRPLGILFGPDTVQLSDTWQVITAHERTHGNIDVIYVTQDGRRIPVSFAASIMRDDAGTPKGVVCVAQDITERLQVQEALEHAKEAAETTNRLKSQFMATMSHELRTPMNGVLGMTELLLGTSLTDRQRRFATTVHRSGQLLLNIINDILDMSKIEAGKLALEHIDFDLRRTIREGLDLITENAHQKGLRLTSRFDDALPPMVRGDPTRLRQILMNLVGNAIKFTHHGEVAIHVTLCETTEADIRLRLEVCDTGIGIAPNLQAHIFSAFTQADGSMTRKYGGTGLGLAITKQLAEMMGGTIDVESELGRGSTFRCTVHLEKSSARPTPQSEPASLDAHPAQALCHYRILLAEDNPVNQDVTVGMLEALGCHVDVVNHGQEALEALSRNPYDLVLMDCQMPNMDGLETTRVIRTQETRDTTQSATRQIPIIALTANAFASDRDDALAAGMDDYLIKPVNLDQLRAVLERWLRPSTASVAAQSIVHPMDNDPSPATSVVSIDNNVLNSLKTIRQQSGSDVLNNVLETYFANADELLATLHETVSNCDAPAVRKAAHRLRSSSSSLGALRLAAYSKELESMARSGTLAQAADVLTQMVTEYETVQVALNTELAKPARSGIAGPGNDEDDSPSI